MHFCMDEIRMVISAVTETPTLVTMLFARVKAVFARLRAACRRCPGHCPGPAIKTYWDEEL